MNVKTLKSPWAPMNVHNRHPNLLEIAKTLVTSVLVLKMAHFRNSTRPQWVTNAWSGTMCECVALPIWTCIIFKGIIIVTVCIIIIIMWQFYVRSLTRLQYQTHSRIWVHLLFCSGGRNDNDNILYVVYIDVFVAINLFRFEINYCHIFSGQWVRGYQLLFAIARCHCVKNQDNLPARDLS